MKRIRIPKVSREDVLNIPLSATMELAEQLDTPVSLKIYLLLKYKEYGQIINGDINAMHYDNVEEFCKDYQIVSMLKKMENIPSDIDTEAVALEKFLDSESHCKAFNDLIFSQRYDLGDKIASSRSTLLFEVQRKISSILGKCPTVEQLECDFGPGATSVSSGVSVSKADKLSAKLHCTREIPQMLVDNIKDCPVKLGAFFGIESSIEGKFSPLDKHFYITDYNSLTFVPKNAKTDRAICVEPHLNTYLQKGIGRYIKQRLKASGLDIDHQAGVNAVYAKQGSIDGSFATIDLSAASDTISLGLVFNILDQDWFELLDKTRSEHTLLPDGTVICNEKFSSMGNGFTFELETLIFYALILVLETEFKGERVQQTARMKNKLDVNPNRVMTFGDDIVVPTYMVNRTVEALGLFGFKLNTEKSFWVGPFRESCGKDYFLGHLVRPYFIKKEIQNVKDLYPILNGMRHFAIRLRNLELTEANTKADNNRPTDLTLCYDHETGQIRERGRMDGSTNPNTSFSEVGASKTVYTAWRFVLSKVPKKFRFFGPSLFGDGVIFTNREVEIPDYKSEHYTGVLKVNTLTDTLLKRSLSRYGGGAALCAALYGVRERFSLRGAKIGHQLSSTPVSEEDWRRDVGKWI